MADETKENQSPETPADNLPANVVSIEDASEATKKITVEIDRKRIDAKYDELFGELRTSAQIPGFRIGHAPRRLMEKRFGKEVTEDVRNGLVSESLAKAIEESKLEVLGDPDIHLDEITVPETGNMTFSVTVEVRPEFEVPTYTGIPVTKPSAEITDERVDEATKQFLGAQGKRIEVKEPASEGDIVIADVKFNGEGIEEHVHENIHIRVAPGVLDGVPLEELGEKLTGVQPGRTVMIETVVPQGHPTEKLRGKKVFFIITVKEVVRIEVPELNDQLASDFGFANAGAFKDFVRQNLTARMDSEVQQSMRDQLCKYLVENTKLELPADATSRQAAAALRRRYIDLMNRGVPREQIEQNLELLQAQAGEQARNEMKLGFILDKIAKAENITVEEGEINSRIAQMAVQYGRRPERLRSELANEGALDQVAIQIAEQKTLDKLLESANIGEAILAEEAAKEKEAAEGAEKPKKSKAKGKGGKKKSDEGEKKSDEADKAE